MTAKEFLRNKKSTVGLRSQSSPLGSEGLEVEIMIEFAKFHVQKALEVASKEADLYDIDSASNIGNQYYGDEVTIIVEKESILNSYPLENIK